MKPCPVVFSIALVAALSSIACGGSGGGSADASGSDGAASSDGAAGVDALPDATSTRVVYMNDFETDTHGFDITVRSELPSDTVGGTSNLLGQRTPATEDAVLSLTGLTSGNVYFLAFDLYVGGTWDGSNAGFGPDYFTAASSSSGVLVHATFRNGELGTSVPAQSYSDATPIEDAETIFPDREGADVELAEPTYYFGHGAGNPILSFTASGATETITFQSADAQAVGDEFIAIDNVVVIEPVL